MLNKIEPTSLTFYFSQLFTFSVWYDKKKTCSSTLILSVMQKNKPQLEYKTWFKRYLKLLYPEYESKQGGWVQWQKAVYIWWIRPASCVGGSSSPQSSGCQVGRNRLLWPWSVGSHAVSQDCVRERGDTLQRNAGDALQMPHNLQKQTDFLVLNHLNMF